VKLTRSRSIYAVARPCVVCLSVCLLLSVMLVYPTQPVEIFVNFSSPFGTLVIGHPKKILQRSSHLASASALPGEMKKDKNSILSLNAVQLHCQTLTSYWLNLFSFIT